MHRAPSSSSSHRRAVERYRDPGVDPVVQVERPQRVEPEAVAAVERLGRSAAASARGCWSR